MWRERLNASFQKGTDGSQRRDLGSVCATIDWIDGSQRCDRVHVSSPTFLLAADRNTESTTV